jgi:metal-responsive CopG/Arc/MetJ family transcriptional regulator
MTTSAKISISLPRPTLEQADRARQITGDSRSEFFRRAVEEYLRQEKRREAIDRYVAGYVAEPESAYDKESSEQTATDALSGEPWE